MSLNWFYGIRIIVVIIGLMAVSLPVQGKEMRLKPSDKVAIVNGEALEREEFDGEVFYIQKAIMGYGKPLTCEQVVSLQKEVLNSMIRRELLYQESRKLGFKAEVQSVKEELRALRRQFSSDMQYETELSRRNISEQVLLSRIKRNSAVKQYVDKQFAARVEVTDDEMIAYYESNLNRFRQPLQIRVSHILILSDPSWKKSEKKKARRKAETILKKVSKGQDFTGLARKFSDGPTKVNGGDLGYIRKGQVEKRFEEAVFALKTGEVTGLIETDYGFHLFKVTDERTETVLGYESVKERIRNFLREKKAKQKVDIYAKTLLEKAEVKRLVKEKSCQVKQSL